MGESGEAVPGKRDRGVCTTKSPGTPRKSPPALGGYRGDFLLQWRADRLRVQIFSAGSRQADLKSNFRLSGNFVPVGQFFFANPQILLVSFLDLGNCPYGSWFLLQRHPGGNAKASHGEATYSQVPRDGRRPSVHDLPCEASRSLERQLAGESGDSCAEY